MKLALSALLLSLAATAATAAPPTPAGPAVPAVPAVSAPPPSGLQDLWVLPHDSLPPAEQVLAVTLQGLANRQQPQIWLRGRSFYAIAEAQLRQEGVHIHEPATVWQLLQQFRRLPKGAVLYRLGTPSLNVAASLCGILDAVAVDESLLPRATAAGLKVLVDARKMDDRQVFEHYHDRFTHGIVLEEALDKPGFMRDLAVARQAFVFSTTDSTFRTRVIRELGPDALVYGWGPDEYGWIRDLSRANATAAPSDWAFNLSALAKLPAGPIHRPRRPAPAVEDGVRYVAFVMTDGDNIQWLLGNFVDHPSYWASPLRGSFPFTWEVSDLLPAAAPRLLQYLYATARPNEGFVTGAGAPGYTYIHFQPDPQSLARQAAPLLRQADLSVVGIANANEGTLRETIPLLQRPEVEGVLYKAYAPYHREGGKVFWYRGKPCVSFRFSLWEGLMGPEELARGIAAMPTSPRTDELSYALVDVHAWSYGKIGGPLEAVRRTIALLPPNTRLITADQLVAMLRRQFGRQHTNDH